MDDFFKKTLTCLISVIALIFYVVVKLETVDRFMAKETLKSLGYTNIEITGFAWFGCSIKYTKRAKFIAISPNGDEVTGRICGDIYQKRIISIDDND